MKEIYFNDHDDKFIALSSYLSTLFFWYYTNYSDCRNLNKREVSSFNLSLDQLTSKQRKELVKLGEKLIRNLQDNSYLQDVSYKKYGNLKLQVFQPRLSKDIVDNIDRVLAEHFGFNDQELDFIINYDIKYRMGFDREDEEDN